VNTQKGFTLVELIVVLVIISLASALVFVSIGGGMLRSEEDRLVIDFVQELTHARSISLARGKTVRFIIDGENRYYHIEGKGHESIPETVQIEAKGLARLDDGLFAVYFFPDGSASGGEIDLWWKEDVINRIKVNRLMGTVEHKEIGQ